MHRRLHQHLSYHAKEFWSFFKVFMTGALTVFAAMVFAIAGISYSLAQDAGAPPPPPPPTTSAPPPLTAPPPPSSAPSDSSQPTTKTPPPPPTSGSGFGEGGGGVIQQQPLIQKQPFMPPQGGEGGVEQRPPEQGQGMFFLRTRENGDQQNNGPMQGDQNRGQQGSFENRQQGGNGEEQGQNDEKQQADMQAREEARMKKELERIQKQLKPMKSIFKRVADRIASIEKQGVHAPDELKANLSDMNAAIEKVMSATTFDEDVQDAMQSMQEKGDAVREAMPKLEQLAQFPRQLKDAERQIRRLDAAYVKAQKVAQKSKIDVSDQISQFKQAVDEIKAGFQKAKDALQSGDVDAASEALQSEVYEKFNDAYEYDGIIRALQNVRSTVPQFERALTNAKRALAKMRKANQDTSEFSSQIDDFAAKLSDFKTLISGKISDPEDLKSSIDDLYSAMQDLMEASNQSTGFAPPPPPKSGFQEFNDFQKLDFGSGGR